MAAETLGVSPSTRFELVNSKGTLSIGRKAKSAFPVGSLVSLDSDGEFASPSASTPVFGVVHVPPTAANDNVATVVTSFVAVVVGKASANLTAGALVREVSASSLTDNVPVYAAATAGQTAHGIVMNTATSGNAVRVALYGAGAPVVPTP